jgi:site-specific DNA-methyltransferase (adenine-specific)
MQDIKIKDQTPHCSKHVLPLVVGGLTITCEDNMELMSRYPDNYFDLAIVDPPYGIGESSNDNKSRSKLGKSKNYGNKNWDDNAPNQDYFNELKRVSKHQVIWGANHFIENIPNANSSCWIVWDKVNGENDFADCELAYCSQKTAVRKIEFRWHGMLQGNMKEKEIRIHPTQKPVALYKAVLDKYAKQGDKILDTHLGSGSIAIACHDYGFELTACELDKEYFEKTKERIINHVAQQKLF